MRRFVIPVRTHLVYVESRGWLLGKLGIAVLVIAGVVLVWGPLVAGRPHAMRLAGWLASAAVALAAVVRVAEAIWGTGCTAYVLVRSLVMAAVSSASAILRGRRDAAQTFSTDQSRQINHLAAGRGFGEGQVEDARDLRIRELPGEIADDIDHL